MPSENVTLKKAVVAGSLLPALGIGALSTALMIEDGIHEGANRNINSIEESIASESNNESVTWFLQDGTGHFMNDSVITSEQFEAIQEHISNGDLGADAPVLAPFRRDLVTLPTPYSDNQASMIISVDSSGPGAALLPDVQKESALCELVDDTCALEKDEIIVDEGEGFVVGDQVSIRGDEYTVVAHPETPQSLVNRLIAYSGSKAGEQTDDHYGFVSVSKSNDSLSALINTANSVELQALSTDEFLAKNEDFWSHNGTPLLILLIADIAVFGGATFASTKRFEQERNAAAVATLQAIGMTKRQLAEQELARNTIMTAKGVVPGALGAVATTQFINSALPGFEGKVTPGMVFGSTGLILAVQGLATLKSIRQTNRRSPIEAMKQK